MHFNAFQFSTSAATREKERRARARQTQMFSLFILPLTKRPHDATDCAHLLEDKSRPKIKKSDFLHSQGFSGNLKERLSAVRSCRIYSI